jgi:hypothetical protein
MTKRRKRILLKKGLKTMLEVSQNNKDHDSKAKIMAKWIYKYFNERYQLIKKV